MTATDGIARRYLHDEVARRLRALIQSGELKPRERLNEVALAERFSISRTPLREAIKILATEGLLDLLPNRGARVASISETEIDEMLEVIAALEATAGERACRLVSPEEIARIEALHAAMAQAHTARDVAAYFEHNRGIHEAIMAASGNATLRAIYATLSGRIQHARFAAHKTEAQWAAAFAEHQQMIDLLRARDGEALGQLLRRHVLGRRVEIAATFGQPGGQPGDAEG